MRIYTKTGDRGQTGLADGQRVAKDDLRIEAYGCVDELNSFMGHLRDRIRVTDTDGKFTALLSALTQIQNELHEVGGELATPGAPKTAIPLLAPGAVGRLEGEMDGFTQELPPLANFVLPGGHELNSLAHICRTVCRRAERNLVTLAARDPVRDVVLIYFNRLSDWLFLVSRIISARTCTPETLWQGRSGGAKKSAPP